jgi:hypothetical protein
MRESRENEPLLVPGEIQTLLDRACSNAGHGCARYAGQRVWSYEAKPDGYRYQAARRSSGVVLWSCFGR